MAEVEAKHKKEEAAKQELKKKATAVLDQSAKKQIPSEIKHGAQSMVQAKAKDEYNEKGLGEGFKIYNRNITGPWIYEDQYKLDPSDPNNTVGVFGEDIGSDEISNDHTTGVKVAGPDTAPEEPGDRFSVENWNKNNRVSNLDWNENQGWFETISI